MKKIVLYIVLALITIFTIGFSKIRKYAFYHKDFVLKQNLKHIEHIKNVETLLLNIFNDDHPSQFWLEHYSSDYNVKPEKSFYYWKVLFSHDELSKSDFSKFQFIAVANCDTCECGLIDINLPEYHPTISVGIKNNKYNFYYCLNRCLDHPNLDKNYDGVIDLQDYKVWEEVKRTGVYPQYLKDRYYEICKEAEEWKKDNPRQKSELDELDELDEIDSIDTQ